MSNPSPERIWYISKYFLKPQGLSSGGRGFYLLKELTLKGYECLVITSDSNHLHSSPKFQGLSFREQLDGVSIVWIKTIKYVGAKSVKRIISWIDFDFKLLLIAGKLGKRPDVVIASSLSLTSILVGIFLKIRFKARLIFEVRDIWPLTLTEEGGFSKNNPFVRVLSAIERLGYRHADAIVGTMPNLEAHVRLVSRSIKPVFCIPMGIVDMELVANNKSKLPNSYTDAMIPRDKFLVGYTGTIGATNALEVIFEAARLLTKVKEIHFVIVGGGDLLPKYKEMHSDLTNLTFVGPVPQEFVQTVLSEFDIVTLATFPSRVWDYGLSLNKLMDYMLASKPIVASFSGYPSLLTEAKCGVFVPAGDAEALVDEILQMRSLEPEALVQMGARGLEWLRTNRKYSVLASKYESILFPHEA